MYNDYKLLQVGDIYDDSLANIFEKEIDFFDNL